MVVRKKRKKGGKGEWIGSGYIFQTSPIISARVIQLDSDLFKCIIVQMKEPVRTTRRIEGWRVNRKEEWRRLYNSRSLGLSYIHRLNTDQQSFLGSRNNISSGVNISSMGISSAVRRFIKCPLL